MPDPSAWRRWVVNVSRNNCAPAVPISVKHVAVEGQDFLVLYVPDGRDKPYRANGRVYVRIDKEVHEATREELGQLFFESGRGSRALLPSQDSNLEKRIQNPLCYHYTTLH